MKKLILVLLLCGYTNMLKSQIVLPIELIGSPGYTKTITVNVTDPTKVKGLWLLVNNLSYENKGSVKINNGAWVQLNNSTVQVPEPAKSYGGIGGGYHVGSIKVTLPTPAGTFVVGANQISFRFDFTDGLSSGYRVVKLNLVNEVGVKLMSLNNFTEEDPNTWVQPISGAAAAAEGKLLWETKEITEGPQSALILRAKCGDCHAKNGRDLKYFNYSNHSIIERSKFHKLTQLEGEKIASYIRSLNVPNPGRPWNPPYQPGPGLDSKPITHWAAGAGLDWVLDTDEMAFGFMFPNGIDTASISLNKVLNVRETPVMLQFPDWNHWLPMIHPYDASFGGDNFINSAVNKLYNGEGTNTKYNYNLTTRIEAGPNATLPSGPLYRSIEGLANNLNTWKGEETEFLKPLNEDLFAPGGRVTWSKKYADEIYSMRLWTSVKHWELIHGNDLEGMGKTLYGPKAEERSWPGLYRHVYDVSPHLLKVPREDFTSHQGKKINQIYLSNVWYHTQPVLNSGNASAGGFSVVDWEYSHGNLNDLRKGGTNTSIGEPARMVINYVKQMQQKHARGIGPEDAWNGWDLFRDHNVYTMIHWDSYNVWDRTDPALKRQLMEAILWVWYKKSISYAPSQYQRQVKGNYPIDPADVVPVNDVNNMKTWADQLFTMIPLFRAQGIDCELMNNICDLGAGLWPLGNWNSLKVNCPTIAYPKVSITSPTNATFFSANTITVNADASVASGTITKVEFYNDKTLIATDAIAPFTADFNNVTAGAINIVVKAYTNQAQTALATRTIWINEQGTLTPFVPPTVLPITLTSFTGKKQLNTNLISWQTANETNNSHFNLERSNNSVDFKTIYTQKGQGNSQTPKYYSYIDAVNTQETVYYRLKQIDFDGKFSYSNIIALNATSGNTLVVYPNPFSNEINISANKNISSIKIISASGQTIYNQTINQKNYVLATANYVNGLYILQVVYNDGSKETVKLLKQ